MDKRQVQLRIEELKFQKEGYSSFNLPTYIAVLFGFTSILFVMLNYFANKGDLTRILWSLKIYFGMIFFTFIVVFIWADNKRSKINLAIQNNYNLLFGRKRENGEVWKRGVMLNKTNSSKRK